MKKRYMLWILLVVINMILLVACRAERDRNVEPIQQASYFELLGVDGDEIEKIILSYQPGNLEPGVNSQTVMQLEENDPLFAEIISNFGKMQLSLNGEIYWEDMKERYTLGNTQVTFISRDEEYHLPLLDVYQKQISKPYPVSWAVYQDSYIYTIDFSKCWEEKKYQGAALYLSELIKEKVIDSGLTRINIPLYYGLSQNAGSWNYDCNEATIFENSDYIFKGKVLENEVYSGYQIEVLDCYKGEWEKGYVFRYQDGTGYDKENGIYYALVNETERPLMQENEYIFFMSKNWMVNTEQIAAGYEAVFLTDRQCGACQIIDGRVWPIFNALPGTSWFTGQTVEEVRLAGMNE